MISNNLVAQGAAHRLEDSRRSLNRSLAQLSSGSRIVSPSDDAAGLAVSSRLSAQVSRLDAARRNVANASSFTQVQDGFLQSAGRALSRMGELAVRAQDATLSDADRALYNQEFQQLKEHVARAGDARFNGTPLFAGQPMEVTIDSEGGTFTMPGINLGGGLEGANMGTISGASAALEQSRQVLGQITSARARLGAVQSRLEFTSRQLGMSSKNLQAANSRVRDVDIAEASTRYARHQVRVTLGIRALQMANPEPRATLNALA